MACQLVHARQHDHRAVAHHGDRARVGRHVERRAAVEVPLVDVGARFDQVRGEIEVQIHDRHDQRRHAMRIRQIEIGAAGDELLRALDAAFARRVQQRREAALVHVLRPRLADDLALPVAHGAVRVDVGTARDQELDHRRLLLRGGPHQRRLLTPELDRVDVGARVEQQRSRFDIARARDGHQRRLAFGVRRVGSAPPSSSAATTSV